MGPGGREAERANGPSGEDTQVACVAIGKPIRIGSGAGEAYCTLLMRRVVLPVLCRGVC